MSTTKLGKKTKNKSTSIKFLLDKNNKKIVESKEIAETMNNFYCEIGTELAFKIQPPADTLINLPPFNDKTIFLEYTNRQEVIEIIESSKPKKGGVDYIHANTLQTLKNFIASPLAHIINLCILTSIWPSQLKTAEIIPIFKSKE